MDTLDLLGRYQRGLLWSGGIALTIMILAASAVAVRSSFRDDIADERYVYLRHKAQLLLDIETKQSALRRTVINAELLWSDHRKPRQELLQDFVSHGCRAVIQRNSKVTPLLVLGSAAQKCTAYTEYLSLSDELAYIGSASFQARKVPLSVYYYDPEQTFIGIFPAPPPGGSIKMSGANDVADLIKRIDPGIYNWDDPVAAKRLRESRSITWLPAARDLFTGEEMFRLVLPAFDGDHPFLVFVSGLASSVLSKSLHQDAYDGNFIILDNSGKLIMSAWRDQATDPGLTQRVIDSKSWQKDLPSPDHYFEAGDFTFSEPLADTGWVLAYAYSWRTILAARWPVLLGYVTGTFIVLSTLWIFLLLFERKVFMPIYRHSQRVFESEGLSRTIIETAPVGLSLLSIGSGETLLRNEVMRSYDSNVKPLYRQFLDLYWGRLKAPGTGRSNQLMDQDLAVTAIDGKVSHLLVNLIETKYQGADVLLCNFSDITTRKLLEQKLEEARVAADDMNRAKSSFLATMSHEIRTPLNAILGNLELLERSALTEMQADRLNTVSSSSKALLTIINDILDFSKVESGQMTLENIRFDAIDLIEQVAAMFAPLADAKGLGLFYTVAPDMPRFYFGDPARLRQVLLNLMSNAIKFTDSGKVSIAVSRHVVAGQAPLLTVSVADTGIGIAAARRSGLFQPFTQGDASISRRFGGSGLGLALCKRLAELMGGTIVLDRCSAAGSTFTVSLPLQADAPALTMSFTDAPRMVVLCSVTEWRAFVGEQLTHWGIQAHIIDDPAEMPAAALPLLIFGESRDWSFAEEDRACEQASWVIEAVEDGPRRAIANGKRSVVSCYSLAGLYQAIAQALAPETIVDSIEESGPAVKEGLAGQSVRILVVEDNKVNLALIRDQLDTLGYQADLTDSGSAALELLEKNRYDIVFTDLHMPRMDGFMFAVLLRRGGAQLPIIAITAHASLEERRRCQQVGIADVMIKPMSLDEIDNMVRKHVNCGVRPVSPHASDLQKPALSVNLLRTLRSSNSDSIALIHHALAAGNMRTVEEQLHSIKGVFAMIREPAVVAVCARLEHLARAVDAPALRATLPEFEAMLDDALTALERSAVSH
jgi:two-component system capsular synthesis sensor histidine kinase RcsC